MRLSLTLLLVATLPGLPAVEVDYTNTPRTIVATVPDLSTTAKIRFFVSADEGKSWQLLAEEPVAPNATVGPSYEFRPDKDGTYLIDTLRVFKSGNPDPDPKPGLIRPQAIELVVDTIKPVLGPVQASLDHVLPDQAVVAVSWSASDAHLGSVPVEVDASADGGATWPVTISGAAQGSGKLTVPIARSSRAIMVRVIAKDLAGNTAQSDPVAVTLPPPPDPAAELAKAVSQLPQVADIVATDQSLALNTPPAATPATPASAPATPAAASAPTAEAATSAPPTPAPAPGTPDVVVPPGSSAGENPADGGFVAGTSLEAAFRAHAQPKPAATPAQTWAAGTGDADTAEAGEEAEANLPPVSPAAPAVPPPVTVPSAEMGFIPNPGAEVLLKQAEEQAATGNTSEALATFARLERSGQATAAISDELSLRERLGDPQGIVDTVAHLPPEYVGDSERLYQARALVALSKPQEALATLAHVHAGAPEAREAMWLMAGCLTTLHKPAQAHRVLESLANGNDVWSARAQHALAHDTER